MKKVLKLNIILATALISLNVGAYAAENDIIYYSIKNSTDSSLELQTITNFHCAGIDPTVPGENYNSIKSGETMNITLQYKYYTSDFCNPEPDISNTANISGSFTYRYNGDPNSWCVITFSGYRDLNGNNYIHTDSVVGNGAISCEADEANGIINIPVTLK